MSTTSNKKLFEQNQLTFNTAIIASIRSAVVGTDTKFTVISWNKGAEQIYGVKAKDILGKFVREAYTTELIDISLAQWQKIMKKQGYWEGDAIQTLKNGKKIIVRSATSYVYDTKGRHIGAVAVNTDITQLHQTQDQLSHQVRRFNNLIENLHQAYVSLDKDFRVLAVNKYATIYTGKNVNELIGKKWADVFPGIEDTPFWKAAQKALQEQSVQTVEAFQPFSKKWFETKYYPTENGIDAFGTDITQRKLEEQQKDMFLAMVAHELKTPLTSAKIFTQVAQKIMLNEKPKNHIVHTAINKVNQQLVILTSLVQDILDLNKILNGRVKLTKEKFYLKDLAAEVIEEIERSTKQQLKIDWHTHLLTLADKERVRQVLTNLLTNAMKYSPKEKQVVIRSKQVKDTIVISIQDFGIGIKKDQLNKIFDKYYQAEENATYPGLGLGLYICKEIINAHHGKIWAESEIGKGSIFYFSLPIYKGK